MINAVPNHPTRRVGKSQGYLGVTISDRIIDGHPMMVTAWELTPKEVEGIIAGEKLYLTVLGTGFPPVMLTVGDPHAPIKSEKGESDV